jgi:hypothetical protein
MAIPEPKLPNLNLPAIRNLPAITHVGCAPGDPNSFVGEQFGNAPDLNSVLHIRSLQKALAEQIYALIQGELPQPAREPLYAARAAQLTNEVTDLVNAMTAIAGEVTGSINAAIDYANEQLTAVNQAKAAITAVPAQARSAVQRLMNERYTRYAAELNAQIARSEAALACLG